MDIPSLKPGIYQHYKGNQYRVHQVARHSETLDWYVFYECLYQNKSGQYWVRPLSMFIEHVDAPDYNYSGPRFTFIKD